MRNTFATIVLLAVLAITAAAHGKAQRIFGDVKEVSATRLVVLTTKNETREFVVRPGTKFVQSGRPARSSDLQVGERVVVEADVHSDEAVADVVKFGKPPKRSQR